jgi:hypothetical protein
MNWEEIMRDIREAYQSTPAMVCNCEALDEEILDQC